MSWYPATPGLVSWSPERRWLAVTWSGRLDSNQLLGNTYAVLLPLSYGPLMVPRLEARKKGRQRRTQYWRQILVTSFFVF